MHNATYANADEATRQRRKEEWDRAIESLKQDLRREAEERPRELAIRMKEYSDRYSTERLYFDMMTKMRAGNS